MTHPVMFSHPNPKNVLIVGGGDGGIIREGSFSSFSLFSLPTFFSISLWGFSLSSPLYLFSYLPHIPSSVFNRSLFFLFLFFFFFPNRSAHPLYSLG